MSLFGPGSRGDSVARVRYTQFSEAPERPGLRTRSLKKKRVFAPSGQNYKFRQQGRPSNPKSQWLPIRREHSQDVEFFEERDGFDVEREV